ncbi:NAD-dependent epimerase/dehydratase family protein [Pseudarthrobacter oxydans]|uniref:NAD-dependent epimerase/dehydratase family protein n=1 Tax=Pseudarthrobacter oxydans TaxID=1671 RepID=UPI0037F86153
MALHTYTQNVAGTSSSLPPWRPPPSNPSSFPRATNYGNISEDLVNESTPTNPESPEEEYKLIGEWLISDQARAIGLRHSWLRYFDVVGSGHPTVSGNRPNILFRSVFGALKNGAITKIFGTTYSTADGTCVRDYVHVSNVAIAHGAVARTWVQTRR